MWGANPPESSCAACAAKRRAARAPPCVRRWSRCAGSREAMEKSTWRTKVGLAEMLKGGVIMDVTNAEQARIAEDAGAVAVMALERVPSDIRAQGGVARMCDPQKIREIMEAVSIP